MRVLHVDCGRELRGGQRQLMMLYEGLEKLGVEQGVLARGALAERLDADPPTALGVRRAAKQADLLHAHDARAHTLASIWGASAPLVVSRRVAFAISRGVASRWKYSRPERFIAVSKHVSHVLRAAGVGGDRIEVIPDAVATPSEEPIFRPLSRPLRVAVIETDDEQKLPGLSRDAVRAAGAELVVCRELAEDLPAADILLYLSKSEGLGSAILAAQAMKKPVVASRVGGIPEAVEHESTGLLVENDLDSIVSALGRFANEPDLSRNCAEAAYRAVLERFRSDMIVERTLEVYRSVLGLRADP